MRFISNLIGYIFKINRKMTSDNLNGFSFLDNSHELFELDL